MNYIINPSWFYWINVADKLFMACVVVSIISGCSLFGSLLGIKVCEDSIERFPSISDGERKRLPCYKKTFKVCLFVFPISLLLFVLVPSKSTLIEMMIAKQATYDNAQWTIEMIKSAVDYIVDAMKQLK